MEIVRKLNDTNRAILDIRGIVRRQEDWTALGISHLGAASLCSQQTGAYFQLFRPEADLRICPVMAVKKIESMEGAL